MNRGMAKSHALFFRTEKKMAPRSDKARSLTKKHIARLERERRQTRMIVIVAAVVIAIVLGLIAYSLLNESVFQPLQTVARVDKDKITTGQFQERVRLQRQQIIGQYIQYYQFGQMFGMDFSSQLQQIELQLSETGAESLGQSVIDAMVNEILVRKEAEKLGITVSEEEIQKRIETAFGYYPDGEPTATVTPTEVTMPEISAEQAAIVTITPTASTVPTESLTGTPTETTTPTLTLTPDLTTTATATIEQTATPSPTATLPPTATALPTQTATPGPTDTPEPTPTPLTKEGFDESYTQSMDAFAKLGISEKDYRELVIADLLNTRMFEHITGDMKPFEEQVWARHILVEDEATANTVRERLLKGKDFAALAKELSKDTGNSETGGDLGWFAKGAMVAPFEEAAFSQKTGEIGKPVQTDFGWHIIQVIGHEDRPLTADQFEQAKQTAFNAWVEELRAKAEEDGLIEIFDIWKERVPLDPDLATALSQ